MSSKGLSYKSAIKEIEDIVSKIENEELDVDELAVYVKRASELIRFCKNKLRKTEEDLDQALDDLS